MSIIPGLVHMLIHPYGHKLAEWVFRRPLDKDGAVVRLTCNIIVGLIFVCPVLLILM